MRSRVKIVSKNNKEKPARLLAFYLALAGIALLILIITIYGSNLRKEIKDSHETTQEARNCGDSLDCLISASEACEPSFAQVEISAESMGLLFNIDVFLAVFPDSRDECILYIRNEIINAGYTDDTISLLLSEGKSWEEIERSNEIIAEQYKFIAEKKEGECNFPEKSQHIDFLYSLKTMSIPASFPAPLECDEIFLFYIGLMQEKKEFIDLCMLFASEDAITLELGESRVIDITGFFGDESEVVWELKDEGILSIDRLFGSQVTITALSRGIAEIKVTDKSVPGCSISIFAEADGEDADGYD